ncbi:TRAP transporter substrate-binding protein DctP [Salinibacterium sp. M195]|uniref:TRAP transporter substrate-binding protein DctP n=1 Tax=Salinibacterium sp. M195 TaxID=2583374 RepID=UPI001C639B36|nr:TRAP transporter substrate-binding protein DctP [Salinibacterium sp. M195]QYH35459.1 hypothetical protein FFT87_05550 [Salinibacterium sp. M195]
MSNIPIRNLRRGTFVAGITALALVAAGCASTPGGTTPDGERTPVVLNLSTTQVEDAPENAALWEFVDLVESKADWISFDYIGGPETIAPNDAAESVQLGAVDIASVCSCYYTQVVPEAGAFDVAPTSPAEDRENGALELQQAWHEEAGFHLLGNSIHDMSFIMHFGPRYKELDIENLDLSSLLMRSAQTAQPAVEAFGAEVVTLPISEVYTAMERNAIDGFAAGNVGMYKLGIAEPIKASLMADLIYVRYPILMNLNTWNSLDEETQTVLTEAMAETEGHLSDIFGPLLEEEHAQWEADGKELLVPSDAAQERIAEQARGSLWDRLIELSPRVQELKDLYATQ